MLSPLIQTFIILAGLLGSGCLAGPTIRPNDIQVLPARELQERLPSIKLGSFDLSTSHINDILIDLMHHIRDCHHNHNRRLQRHRRNR
ncbi:hypothetical protein BKA64DRAFT_140358 [Cadophora sp. MPI-SDFR-AT-0126]|nr:hypothetical protein BKA64DRAFT_140358 [Leotiomycetes sp. MPI-SDFR-AT-0126]